MKKIVFLSLAVMMALALTLSPVTAAPTYAAYFSHTGTMTIVSASTIAEAVSTPYDGKFVQLAPYSSVTLKFPGNYAAVPDGTSAPDLQVDIFDEFFPASAEISVSLNGTNWTSVGVYSDVANIDLDLEARGPVKYVKIDQGNNYIDPAYPTLGFDLDGVAALNAALLPYGAITSPAPSATISGIMNFEAIYWDDDPGGVQWAVRSGTCVANTGTVIGNVDGKNSPYTWDGHLFKATTDTSTWANGIYCFVFNPTESSGETDIRLTQFNVASNNRAPIANAGGPYTGSEGSSVAFDGSGSSDPDSDAITFVWDFGDGSSTSSSPSHIYADNGTYPVCLTVSDGKLSNQACTTAIISNVAPTLGAISVDQILVSVNTIINASANFTDPGIVDTHSAAFDWGDASAPSGPINETGGNGTATGGHNYNTPGVYTIKLIVTDKDGSPSNESVFQYVVVYDPTAGFVTGGGWINSPAGAYKADPTLSGKATFGFVAKYQKGANVPTGNTEFQFKVGDLNFKSTSYDWLVVAGTNAKFKGVGSINGEGTYKFMINADDGNPDAFRIQIWDAGDGLVYDNGSQQALGGGSIVVHN